MRINELKTWLGVGSILIIFLVQISVAENEIAPSMDCYYNYNHYSEGDRILTNEPCLNCTCHNRMLMCYLKVCPFTKPIGQDCKIEKREDQCCPVITCPEVTVELDHSIASQTALAKQHQGCTIDSKFYAEGTQVPGNVKKPCEICYCIRNMTSCVMQECTLHVDGCRPIYNKGVCCPVRYDCAYADEVPLLEDLTTTTTEAYSPGFVITTTSSPVTSDCIHGDTVYNDGELVTTDQPCEHCYCMRGDIVCAVQECGTPLDVVGKNCTARLPREGECCPDVYDCEQKDDETQIITHADDLPKTGDDSVATTISPIEAEPAVTEGVDDSENEIHDKDDSTEKPIIRDTTDRVEDVTTVRSEEIPAVTSSGDLGQRISEDQTNVPPVDDGIAPTSVPIDTEPSTEENLVEKEVKPIGEETSPKVAPEATTLPSIEEEEEEESKTPTTVSPTQSEGEDDSVFLANVIPGEGDCLVDGISYSNSSTVAPRNKCEFACACLNSIVQCEKVKCPPLPQNSWNCKISRNGDECCLKYDCEEPPTTQSAHQDIVTEIPNVTSRIEDEAQNEGSGEVTTQTSTKSKEEVAGSEAPIAGTTQLPSELEEEITAKPIVPQVITLSEETASQTPIDIESHKTELPVTELAVTELPVTGLPNTGLPVTELPVTEVPVTKAPVTEVPVTKAPVTEVPVTEVPVTEVPVTEVPVTEVPQAESISTETAPPKEVDSVLSAEGPKATVAPATVTEKDSIEEKELGPTTAGEAATQSAVTESSEQQQPEPAKETSAAPDIETAETGATGRPISADHSTESVAEEGTLQPVTEQPIHEIVTERKGDTSTESAEETSEQEGQAVTTEAVHEKEVPEVVTQAEEVQTKKSPIQKEDKLEVTTEAEREASTHRVAEQPNVVEVVTATEQQQLEGSTEAIYTVTPSGSKTEISNKKVDESTDSYLIEERTTSQPISIVLPEVSTVQQPDIMDLVQHSTESELPVVTEKQPEKKEQSDTEAATTASPVIANVEQVFPDKSTDKPEIPLVSSSEEEVTERDAFKKEPIAPVQDVSSTAAPVKVESATEIVTQASVTEAEPVEIQKVEPVATESPDAEPSISTVGVSQEAEEVSTQGPTIPEKEKFDSDIQTTAEPEIVPQDVPSSTEQVVGESASTAVPELPIEPVVYTQKPDEEEQSVTTQSAEAADRATQIAQQPADVTDKVEVDLPESTQAPVLIEKVQPPSTISEETVEATTISQSASQAEEIEPLGTKPAIEPTDIETPSTDEPIKKEPQLSVQTEKEILESTTQAAVSEEDEASTEVVDSKLKPSTERIDKVEATTLGIAGDVETDQATEKQPEQQRPDVIDVITEKLNIDFDQSISSTEAAITEIQEQATEQPSFVKPLETETGGAPTEVGTTEESSVNVKESSTESITRSGEESTTEQKQGVSEQSSIEPQPDISEVPTTQIPIVNEESQPSTERGTESPESIPEKVAQPEKPIESIEATTLSKTEEESDAKYTTEALQEAVTEIVTEAAKKPPPVSSDEATTIAASPIEAEASTIPSAEKTEPIGSATVPSGEVEAETPSPVTDGPQDEVRGESLKPVSLNATEQGDLELSTTSHLEQPTTQRIAEEEVTVVAKEPISQTNVTESQELEGAEKEASTTLRTEQDELVTEAVTDRVVAPVVEVAFETSSQVPYDRTSKPDLIHVSDEEEQRPTTVILGPEFKPQSTVDLFNLVTGGSFVTEPAIFDVVPTRIPPTTVVAEENVSETEEPVTQSDQISSSTRQPETIAPEIATSASKTEQPAIVTEVPTTQSIHLDEQKIPAAEQNETIYEPIATTLAPVAPVKSEGTLDDRIETDEETAATATSAPSSPLPFDASTTIRPDEIPSTITNRTVAIEDKFNQTSTPTAQKKPSYPPPAPSYDSYGQVSSEYPGSTYTDEEYTDEEEPTVFGPGTCRYGGKLYVSAQQIPRDDPCDFCFCFRSDIICLQQSCPPPISGCHEEPIQGFCCPRYECPVSMALVYNASTSTTTTTTLPPHMVHYALNNTASKQGCQIQGTTYQKGEAISVASGPCIDCICGGDGQMKCEPKICTPEPMLQQMIAIAASRR